MRDIQQEFSEDGGMLLITGRKTSTYLEYQSIVRRVNDRTGEIEG